MAMNLQMEITLRCNAQCPSCSRHCHYGLYDESSDVTMEQVLRFCEEVKCHGGIDLISIMGGEPTVHPDLKEIIALIMELKDKNHIKRCQVVTNGKIVITDVPGIHFEIIPEEAQIRIDNHRCQFVSPYDTGQEIGDCKIIDGCGISWGAYGWWPCGAGGAICRLMGIEQFRTATIPPRLLRQEEVLPMCVHCQVKAKKLLFCRDFGDIRSISFRNAVREFDAKKLRRY